MRFLIDENVPKAVADCLRDAGYDVVLSVELVKGGSPDPIVATAAMENERILVSHDKDMKSIDRYISAPQLARFPTLSRLQLCCFEVDAAARVGVFLPIIEAEFAYTSANGEAMRVEIGRSRVRICR